MTNHDEFEQHLAPVLAQALAMATRLTGGRDDAEDLVQDAAVQAYRAFGSFTPGTNFRAWFFKILVNRFLNQRRSASRQGQNVALDELGEVAELFLYDQSCKNGLQKRGIEPAKALFEKFDDAAVREALMALPDEFRAVAVLYFLEEMPYDAIAATLEVPLGTVRSRLHRARKHLQKALWEIAAERGLLR